MEYPIKIYCDNTGENFFLKILIYNKSTFICQEFIIKGFNCR